VHQLRPTDLESAALALPRWPRRLKASSVHLLGSLAVAALAAALVYRLWYPWPYTALAGGTGLFVLIVAVDVVLGPLITFVVFAPGKPHRELWRDLSIVVAVQLAALVYGLTVMYEARPVVLALETNRFRVVSANEVVADELPLAPETLRRLSVSGPALVRAQAPNDPQEVLEAIQRALAGADIGTRPKYWRPWNADARRETLSASHPLEALRQRYLLRAAEVDEAVARTGFEVHQLRYLPVLSRFADWVVLIDAATGEPVGFAPFDGF
jgi:hypothetical protein